MNVRNLPLRGLQYDSSRIIRVKNANPTLKLTRHARIPYPPSANPREEFTSAWRETNTPHKKERRERRANKKDMALAG